jgi:hypothetical protein
MPRWSSSSFCARTISGTVTTGNRRPYSRPVAGSMLPGPELPEHPPMTFEQIMKYLSVSNALPGPIIMSHHPGFASPG